MYFPHLFAQLLSYWGGGTLMTAHVTYQIFFTGGGTLNYDWQGRQSIPKSGGGGGGPQTRKVRGMLPEIFF
jgi:hypothetical protein